MRKTALILICMGVLAGCDGLGGPPDRPSPIAAPDGPGASASAATRPAGREVMAYVNGQPVYMDALYELLLGGPGRQFALELVRHEMVRQAAEKQGITVGEQDLKMEHKRLLKIFFPQIEQDADRERALGQLLVLNQVSRKQWEMSVHTSALVHRMASPEVEISDQELQDEFGRQYGRQVIVRHIQTAKLAEAQEVKELAATQDFAALAARYSINLSARDGGRLPPIGPKTEGVPPAIRQTALTMKKVGEISDPVQTGTTFHILKLEQIVEPKKVKFEDVREKLTADLKERRVRLYEKTVMERLIRQAKVQYVNPILKANDAAARLQQEILP